MSGLYNLESSDVYDVDVLNLTTYLSSIWNYRENLVITINYCLNIAPSPKSIKQYLMYHYSAVIRSAMASQITSVSIVWSSGCSGADKDIYIKAPHHWPLWWESIGDWWIPSQRASNAEIVSIWWRYNVPSASIYEVQPYNNLFTENNGWDYSSIRQSQINYFVFWGTIMIFCRYNIIVTDVYLSSAIT